MPYPRIEATAEALELIAKIEKDHGPLMFHQSGGCCDGSSPMCYPKGDFIIGASDVWLGNIAGHDMYMSADQFEYWKHTHLTLDVTKGRGASFSLDIPYGMRFVIKSRLFTETELADLTPIHQGPKEEDASSHN